ncbi:MAG: FHA domain-containing protein [Planctomycetia bacterium]|nr:FHA domain-containing protein [Planctomycetia bacterium]
MKPPDPRENAATGPRRQATVLESVEEIRAQARRASTAREPAPTAAPPASQAAAPDAAEPFRPVERPSMALLTVIDDGEDTGEVIRIRGGSFVIGRVEGQLVVPHDGGISGRHAEIVRRPEGGQFRWYLRDLQSTNGTFVRVASVILHPDQEFVIGRRRFRFEPAGSAQAPAALPGPGPADATRKWQAITPQDIAALTKPALVELTPQGEGPRFPLDEPEVWIGRASDLCRVVVNDPTVDPRHARAYRDSKNRWVLENARSVNGLWVRVQELPLERGGQFQCGEQRFVIRIL